MTFISIYPEESTIHFHETLSSVSGTNAINTMMLIRVTKIKKETLEKSSDNVANIYFFHQMFFFISNYYFDAKIFFKMLQ